MPSVESPLKVAEASRVIAQAPAPVAAAPAKAPFVCPVDPAERAQCDSCQ